MRLSLVVPCFNEEDVLPQTAERLLLLIDNLRQGEKIDDSSGIFFIDDGSSDRTWEIIQRLSTDRENVHGIKLSRNEGHQNALIAGLQIAPGDALVSIDADLQDDIDVIEMMVDRYQQGFDIVYGVRAERKSDTWFKRWSAQGYYRVLHLMGVKIVFNHADYRLLSRRALNALEQFEEVNLFLRGIVPLLGFRTTEVAYERKARAAGVSKYPLNKMLGLALDGVTSFSAVPLRLITITGLSVFGVSMGMGLWALWVRLFSDMAIPGWASTVVPFYFLGGVQLFCIGIIGEYLGKIYLEVKRRPRYFVEERT